MVVISEDESSEGRRADDLVSPPIPPISRSTEAFISVASDYRSAHFLLLFSVSIRFQFPLSRVALLVRQWRSTFPSREPLLPLRSSLPPLPSLPFTTRAISAPRVSARSPLICHTNALCKFERCRFVQARVLRMPVLFPWRLTQKLVRCPWSARARMCIM